MFYLYKLTFTSGKSYIGQTRRSMKARIDQHRNVANRGSKLAVHCAWRQYGDPSIEVLGEFACPDALHKAEIDAIQSHGTLSPNGYNISVGGDTAPSLMPEVAAKISKACKGRKHSEEKRKADSDKMKAKWQDPEYREKLDKSVRASWTPERRSAAAERARARFSGRMHTEESKEKMREAKKNISPETRERMRLAQLGKKRGTRSDETKLKMSNSQKAAAMDKAMLARRGAAISGALQAKRQELSEAAKKRWQDPEYRAKIAKAKSSKESEK